MARGFKTGGRQTGTPNRRTAEVAETLASLGCDPIEGMARIAMDEANPPELRGRMFAELAGYVAPKRRAIEARIETDDYSRIPVPDLLKAAAEIAAFHGIDLTPPKPA